MSFSFSSTSLVGSYRVPGSPIPSGVPAFRPESESIIGAVASSVLQKCIKSSALVNNGSSVVDTDDSCCGAEISDNSSPSPKELLERRSPRRGSSVSQTSTSFVPKLAPDGSSSAGSVSALSVACEDDPFDLSKVPSDGVPVKVEFPAGYSFNVLRLVSGELRIDLAKYGSYTLVKEASSEELPSKPVPLIE